MGENWAKKRRPEWMAATGKIRYTRERLVHSQEREVDNKGSKGTSGSTAKEIPIHVQKDITQGKKVSDNTNGLSRCNAGKEIPIHIQRDVGQDSIKMLPKARCDSWPRKRRSDITSQKFL